MESDIEGFLYPRIDASKCNECGLCKRACAFQNGYDTKENFDTPYVYAVKHTDEKIRMSSTSGGAFTAIAEDVFDSKGVIYGVAFDADFNVIHQRAETIEENEKFKGSKYVQSDLKNIFQKVKDDLTADRLVLFTGTPCQTAGLSSYLTKKEKSNLLLCDIVCYGTPSPLIWKEHICFLEKKMKTEVDKYYFRSKVKGWKTSTVKITYKNGKNDYKSSLSQTYKILFYSRIMMRPACYNCKYMNFNRPSDITIADFWGIEKHMPEFFDNKGVSLVLVNNLKGEKLFNKIQGNIEHKESNISVCAHSALHYPAKPPFKRDEFWSDYNKHGYKFIVKKYANCGYKDRIKKIAKRILQKTGFLFIIKKLLRRD